MANPKLLLADDSVTIRKVVELTFSDEGIDVTTTGDAESAMQKFVEIQPDIVLVDVGLEGTSGYRICEMIKHDDATRHIPVLLLVGSFEPFDQEEAERVNADGFLTKPFQSIRDLVSRVKELLEGQSSNIEPDPAEPSATPEPGPNAVDADTADIEDLYNSSFAQTAEIEEFDTVDDLLGDAGMDDQLIEASYLSSDNIDVGAETIPFVEHDEQTKEFDWSPASVVTDETPAERVSTGFEPKFVFEETSEVVADDFPPQDDEPFSEVNEAEPIGTQSFELSDEMIDQLAERIVERLSDRVVREIAQKAVPEIAEKLIREALDEDKKG